MQLILDKHQKGTLFDQALQQLLTGLHTGKLRPGDRLPSVRQMAIRNRINNKTAFSIYQRLKEEGYVELRTGSGAYVSERERVDLDEAYCLAVLRLFRSNLLQASRLRLDQHQYAELLEIFLAGSNTSPARLAVIECNEEQVNLFAREISDHLDAHVYPLLLNQLERSNRKSAKVMAQVDYFATTDYHFKAVAKSAAKYQKKVLKLRLNPVFLPGLVSAAQRGKVLMVVSNTDFFPAFRQNLTNIGISATLLNKITAVDDTSFSRVRAAASRVQFVYVSPICNPRVREAIPISVEEIRFDSMLSQESIESLEAVMLFHNLALGQRNTPDDPAGTL